MGKMDLDEAEKAELLALGKEYAARSKKIREAWRKALPPNVSRAECNTADRKELEAEVKRRYGEILEKYKALRAEQDQDQ